jgi:hypothetical protein
VDIDFKQLQRKVIKDAAKSKLPEVIKESILGKIAKGISPVRGIGRFKKYSQSYRDAIGRGVYTGKRKRPVNLKLSGDMINSFYVRAFKDGFKVGFTDEKADYHNRTGPGGKKSARRRLLPTRRGSRFTKSIIRDIIKAIKQLY